jgi:hypothetical protein
VGNRGVRRDVVFGIDCECRHFAVSPWLQVFRGGDIHHSALKKQQVKSEAIMREDQRFDGNGSFLWARQNRTASMKQLLQGGLV